MIITVDRARRHEVLGPIIEENPQVFSSEAKAEWKQLTLVLFLLYEQQKGEESFWKPYLDTLPDFKFFCLWDEEVIR